MRANITLRATPVNGKAHYVIHPEPGQILPQWYLAHFRDDLEAAPSELTQPSAPPILRIPWLLPDSPLPWLGADLSLLNQTGSPKTTSDTSRNPPAEYRTRSFPRRVRQSATNLLGWCRRPFSRMLLFLDTWRKVILENVKRVTCA